MKKSKLFISIFVSLILVFLISVVSFADNSTLRISEDYTSIEYGGVKYIRVPYKSDDIVFYAEEYFDFAVEYTEKQEADIENINLSGSEAFLRLSIDFAFGGHLYEHYVREDMLDEYNAVASLTSPTLSVYIDSTRVYIEREKLYGEIVTMPADKVMMFKQYEADNRIDDHFCYKYSGVILLDGDGGCYYLDFAENGTEYGKFSELDHDELILHKITDTELCPILRGEVEIGEKSMSFIYVSAVLVILIFGVAPLVFGVFCFIKLKNAKQPYRILYTIGVSLSALAVILLITLAVIVLPLI